MAVGSAQLGKLNTVPGVRMSAVAAGIKKPGRADVVVFELAPGSISAGVFTSNAFCAAPVTLCKTHLQTATPRYFLINTGNANAGTGKPGMQAAEQCCVSLAADAGVPTETVLPFSTGVIGELLPAAKIQAVTAQSLATLKDNAWEEVAKGIMTTDTRPKACSKQLSLAGKLITITGITKGAGMIKPDMATMLAYIFTDIEMTVEQAQRCVSHGANLSFNRVTVDGDTSTNDSCMLVATGKSGLKLESLSAAEKAEFDKVILEVFIELAQAIIRDGEGATKFVTVNVVGGANSQECLAAAYAVAESPLVKTALFASDPNWGRILAAVGRAGIKNLDVENINVHLDDVCIVSKGARAQSYTEAEGQKVFSKEEFAITIDLSRGACSETLWTCDYSYDYIKINADYRT